MKKEESMNKALFRLNAKAESEKVYDFLIQLLVSIKSVLKIDTRSTLGLWSSLCSLEVSI